MEKTSPANNSSNSSRVLMKSQSRRFGWTSNNNEENNNNNVRMRVPQVSGGFVLLALAFLALCPVFAEYSWGSPSQGGGSGATKGKTMEHQQQQPPVFDTSVSGSAGSSVLIGQTAYLPCRVKHLGDKVVSWIRQRDLHILTSGQFSFSSDPRVEVVHPPNSDLWTLRIVSARLTDQGKYECQVNTEPKMMRAVHLEVKAEADMRDSPYTGSKHHASDGQGEEAMKGEVRITGPAEQFVKAGSTVTFTCIVGRGLAGSVAWFHGSRPVSARQPLRQGGVSVDTERGEAGATSRLTLTELAPQDAGNYSCVAAVTAPNAQMASLQLIVVEGEHTEAMQRDMSASSSPPGSIRSHGHFFTWMLCPLTVLSLQTACATKL